MLREGVARPRRVVRCPGEEFVRGTDARSFVKARRGEDDWAPIDLTLRIGLSVSQALILAHSRKILHGDVKPSNIVLTADGEIRLLDIGVSHLLLTGVGTHISGLDTRSETQLSLGTPEVMPPEQSP